MADDILRYTIEANLKDFSSKITELSAEIVNLGEKGKQGFGGANDAYTKMTAAFLSAAAIKGALIELKNLAMDCIKAFDDQAVSMAQITRFAGAEGADELGKYALEQSKQTRYTKDEILASERLLLQHHLNTEEVMKLMPAVLDYGTIVGSATQAAQGFANAIEYGTTHGLRPFGIEVEKTGTPMEIFNEILTQSQGPIKEAAVEMGNLGTGPAVKLQHQLKALQEGLGKEFLPVFIDLIKAVKAGIPIIITFADGITVMVEHKEYVIGGLVAMGIAVAVFSEGVQTQFKAMTLSMMTNPIGIALVAIAAGITAITYALGKWKQANKEQEEAAKKTYEGMTSVQIGNRLEQLKKDEAEKRAALNQAWTAEGIDQINKDLKKIEQEKKAGFEMLQIADANEDALRKSGGAPSGGAGIGGMARSGIETGTAVAAGEKPKSLYELFHEDLASQMADANKRMELSLKQLGLAYESAARQGQLSEGMIVESFNKRRVAVSAAYDLEIKGLANSLIWAKDEQERKKIGLEIADKQIDRQLKLADITNQQEAALKKLSDLEQHRNDLLMTQTAKTDESGKKTGGMDAYVSDSMAPILAQHQRELEEFKKTGASEVQITKMVELQKREEANKTAQFEKDLQIQKLQQASTIAGQMQELAQGLYEETGSKSIALFDLAKAAGVAQATMNTAEAITKALATMGPIIGPIEGIMIGALGAVQIAKIISQQAPKKKAESGGVVVGPLHSAGGVNLNVEGGESILNRMATAAIGPATIHAINSGSIASSPARSSAIARAASPKHMTYNILHDSAIAKRLLNGPDAKDAIINHIQDQSFRVNQALSR